jgi:hypothetical protein
MGIIKRPNKNAQAVFLLTKQKSLLSQAGLVTSLALADEVS